VFTGNKVLTGEELRTVVARHLNTVVSTGELENIREGLTRYYIDKGYVNSGALLPDQLVDDGIVNFVLVEGELSKIEVRGNKTLRAEYIKERIRLSIGPPLNVNELREGIQIMLEDPQIARMDAALVRGERLGEGILNVDVKDGKFFDARLNFDNYRSPSVGELQPGVHMRFQNFTGWGDTLFFSHFRTEGLSNTFARFEIPVTPRDTKLFLRFEGSDADVVQGLGSELDIESESKDFEFGVTHPLYRAPGKELLAQISLNPRKSTTFLLGQQFSFSPGVQNGESKVAPLRIALNWLQRDRIQVLAARSVFSIGLDFFGVTENSGDLPDSDYFSWLGQLQWIRRVTDRGDQLVIRADAQLTPDSLLPLEKFSVGGPLSVRGYLHNQLVRDNGFSGTIEGRVPLFRLPVPGLSKRSIDGMIEFAPFFDMGYSRNTAGPSFEPDFISSLGAGLRWNLSDGLRANLYYAVPLNNVPDPDGSSLQADGISFQIVANVF
jgi:hemolysin activation/secretion protein